MSKLEAGKTISILAAVVLCLAAAEMVVRVYEFLSEPAGMFVADPACGVALKPGFESAGIKINSLGFRDQERRVEKSPGSLRVIILGDSFVFGAVDPEDNFPALLEERLNAAWTGKVEVVPMGVPGYGTTQELALIETKGLVMAPDVVVLCYYAGNDAYDSARSLASFNGDIVSANSQRHKVLSVLRKSHLVRFVEWVYRYKLDRDAAAGLRSPFSMSRFIEIQASVLDLFRKHPAEYVRRAWKRSMDALDRMKSLLARNRIAFGVCIIPAEIQVDHVLFEQTIAFLGIDPDDLDLDLPQKTVKAWAGKRCVPVMDPTAEFRRLLQSGSKLYLERNTHLNEQGCKVLSGMLEEFVRDLLARNAGGRR